MNGHRPLHASYPSWAAGEHFGSLFSGTATDPNSGPLLLLIAAAFWPRRQR